MDKSTREALQYNWRKIKKDDYENLFRSFSDFSEWSLSNGFFYGARLIRIDQCKGWSRENCKWVEIEKRSKRSCTDRIAMEIQWNKFVSPIRKRYKKELDSILDGDPIVKQPEPPKEETGKVFFQYEHPDLIREGIVFVGGTK